MANDLLTEIREFLDETGMSRSYFGKAANGDSALVDRLEAGGSVTLTTAETIRIFMVKRRAGEIYIHKPEKGRRGRRTIRQIAEDAEWEAAWNAARDGAAE